MGYLSCNADSAIATCDPHYWDLKKKRRNPTNKPKALTTRNRNHAIREFLYTDLVAATNAFSADSFLGKGSHGRVYRATLNLDGVNLIAAVKTTKLTAQKHKHKYATNCTGCGNCTGPAENEIEILSRVPSPRLVNLIGYCTDPNGNKLIVVEYMPNGSLHDLLHSATRPPGWTRRVRFALHVAKAVHALHASNPPVIHRDIKSSNVLIDGEWNARLGDFGLALRGHVEDVRVKCTPPAGTLGYLDPCYLAPQDLSAKSDVFSFGILLLELISGRNAIDVNYSPPSVVDWAVPLIRRGDFAGICDRRIGTPSDMSVTRQLAVLAARCVRSTAEKRPAMAEVVECLKLVRKRIHASPIWSRLRRRVERVERSEACDCDYYECDGSEEVVKRIIMKGGGSGSGSRRNSKVSSVPGVEYESEPSNKRGRRSKSISKSIGSGSVSGIINSKQKPGGRYPNQRERETFGRRKEKSAVTAVTTRLKKSKSMGVLQGPLVLRYYGGGENGNKIINDEGIHSAGERERIAMSKLVITGKLEKKMLEKPLVNSHGWESE